MRWSCSTPRPGPGTVCRRRSTGLRFPASRGAGPLRRSAHRPGPRSHWPSRPVRRTETFSVSCLLFASLLELHRNGDIPTSFSQLVDALDHGPVQLHVLKQDRTDVFPCNLGGPAGRIEGAVLENKVGQLRIPAIDVDLPAVMLPRAVQKVEVIQSLLTARARRIAPPREIRGSKLNPNGELIRGRDEMHILETYMLSRRDRAVPQNQRRSVAVIHIALHHHVFEAGAGATIKGKRVVHRHGKPVFDEDMFAAAGDVISIVVVLLLAVDELDVPAGETVGIADRHRPIGGPQKEQILEGDVLAVVDHVALDAISMRIIHQSFRGSGAPVTRSEEHT